MVLFRSATLFCLDFGSETKGKQNRRLGKKRIVHMSDSKDFCLFVTDKDGYAVVSKDSETSRTLRGRGTATLETSQHTKGHCNRMMSLPESILLLFEPSIRYRISQTRTVRNEAEGHGLAGRKLG